ncbi:MAG: hypothetical protein GXO65_01765, partial [Euryarchaeota archaeon]|nr:hypothetical protein [Euryarchaeota archaeon]
MITAATTTVTVATTITTTTTAAATAASAVSNVATSITGISIDFAHVGLVATVFLIGVLIAKELITSEPGIRTSMRSVLKGVDMSIGSLLGVFAVIVAFKIFVVVA